jgi:hypothetical protein
MISKMTKIETPKLMNNIRQRQWFIIVLALLLLPVFGWLMSFDLSPAAVFAVACVFIVKCFIFWRYTKILDVSIKGERVIFSNFLEEITFNKEELIDVRPASLFGAFPLASPPFFVVIVNHKGKVIKCVAYDSASIGFFINVLDRNMRSKLIFKFLAR